MAVAYLYLVRCNEYCRDLETPGPLALVDTLCRDAAILSLPTRRHAALQPSLCWRPSPDGDFDAASVRLGHGLSAIAVSGSSRGFRLPSGLHEYRLSDLHIYIYCFTPFSFVARVLRDHVTHLTNRWSPYEGCQLRSGRC